MRILEDEEWQDIPNDRDAEQEHCWTSCQELTAGVVEELELGARQDGR